MADGIESVEQIEAQLADVNELLAASPEDESLISLKGDLEELLALSRQQPDDSAAVVGNNNNNNVVGSEETSAAADCTTAPIASGESTMDDLDLPPLANHVGGYADDNNADNGAAAAAVQAGSLAAAAALPDDVVAGGGDPSSSSTTTAAAAAAFADTTKSKTDKKKKKTEELGEFVLPAHLIPNEADNEKEVNRKRRAAKALKSKWRAKKKELESESRKQSWQTFQKKTSKRKGGAEDSMFSTKEGVDDRVGVSSKKQLTDFGARKRHKQG